MPLMSINKDVISLLLHFKRGGGSPRHFQSRCVFFQISGWFCQIKEIFSGDGGSSVTLTLEPERGQVRPPKFGTRYVFQTAWQEHITATKLRTQREDRETERETDWQTDPFSCTTTKPRRYLSRWGIWVCLQRFVRLPHFYGGTTGIKFCGHATPHKIFTKKTPHTCHCGIDLQSL